MKRIFHLILLIILIADASGQAIPGKKSSLEKNFPGLKLSITDHSRTDSTKILFIPGMTTGLDPSWDLSGYGYDQGFHLYTSLVENNGHTFSVQCLPDEDFSGFIIPVGMDCSEGGIFTFELTVLNDLSADCYAILEDRQNNKFTDLRKPGAEYVTDIPAGSNGFGRFYLYTFDPETRSLGSGDNLADQFKIHSCNKSIYISGSVPPGSEMTLYNLTGQAVKKIRLETGPECMIEANDLSKGIYILQLSYKGYDFTQKIMLW